MFHKTSNTITENLVKSGTITSADKEVYLFGIQQGFVILLNILTTIVLGILLETLWQILLFTISYIGLRSFAGGYHAKTPQRCYIMSTILTLVVALLQKYIALSVASYIGLLLFSTIIILVLSPVENNNKPLDDLEKRVYRRTSIIVCLIEVLITITLLLLNIAFVGSCIIWAMFVVSIMMILGTVHFPRKEDALSGGKK
jgi:accessory gene regulator B